MLLFLLLSQGCEKQTAKTREIELGGHELTVEIALTRDEHKKGLMHRKHLPENAGMLFVFNRPKRAKFWMKNTRIPLSIGYFNVQGELLEIYPLYPNDLNGVPSRSNEIAYALEVNQGWFKEKGVRPGAKLKSGSRELP